MLIFFPFLLEGGIFSESEWLRRFAEIIGFGAEFAGRGEEIKVNYWLARKG